MEILKFDEMIQQSSFDQLEVTRKISKVDDIDDKVRRDIKEPPMDFHNPIDNKVETYQQYLKEPFKVNQNIKKWNEGAMVNKNSLNQLKRVADMSKTTDVGNKIDNNQTSNSKETSSSKTLDVETYQKYEAEPFKTNQNTKSK